MSSLGRDVRHGVGIARVELRRSVRRSFGTRRRQVTLVGFVAAFAPLLVFWFRIASAAGRDAAREGSLPLDVLGVQVSLLVLAFVAMGALRVVQQGRPEGDALLLTATTPRAVLLGLTIHGTVQLVGFVSLPTLLFAAGFAYGAGTPSLVVTAVLAVVPLFTAVSMLGTVVGQLVVLGLLRSRLLRRASRGFGLILLLVLLALGYAATAPAVGASSLLAPLSTAALPAVRYLAFAFVGTPFGPALGAGAFLVGALVVASVPALFAVANRLAPRLWFADATPTDLLRRDASSAPATPSTVEGTTTRRRLGGGFPPRAGPRFLSVAAGLWVRWVRIPVRFSALFPLVVVLVTALFGVVGDPESLPFVVGGALVYGGVYVSGAVFGLNPLGEAGGMRIVEFLSATPPRTLVLGHATAGLLVGAPLAVVGAAVLAVAAATSLPTGLLLAGLVVVLTAASAGVGLGVGSALPARDAQRTYRGYEVATPSQWALFGYVLAVTALVGVAAVGAVPLLGTFDVGGASLLGVATFGVAAVSLVVVGYAGYRIAIGRFSAPPYRAT